MRLFSCLLLICFLGGDLMAQWSPFANGNTNGTVIDLQWYNGELYAGGFFTQINGDNASSVAKWDGTNWLEVAGGLEDGVHSLPVAIMAGREQKTILIESDQRKAAFLRTLARETVGFQVISAYFVIGFIEDDSQRA